MDALDNRPVLIRLKGLVSSLKFKHQILFDCLLIIEGNASYVCTGSVITIVHSGSILISI